MNIKTFLEKHNELTLLGSPLPPPYVFIANSRQTKHPVGSDAWVETTLEAIKDNIKNGFTIISSVGMNTYEIVCFATGYFGGNQIIFVPIGERENKELKANKILNDFRLNPEKTGFIFIKTKYLSLHPKIIFKSRDELVSELADIIVPISIRPKGNLEQLIRIREAEKKKVERKFLVPYIKERRKLFSPLDYARLELKWSGKNWNYLTHYTHTSNGPWTNESPYNFYKAIIESKGEYPRSAFVALKNIIIEKRIRTSSRFMREGFKAVSFTALAPHEAFKIAKWRPRYLRYSFEPYGIAISNEIAAELNIHPVIYGDEELYKKLDNNEKPLFQPKGKTWRWEQEKEWRATNDIDLSCIPKEKMLIIVRNQKEIIEINRLTDINTITIE